MLDSLELPVQLTDTRQAHGDQVAFKAEALSAVQASRRGT